MVFISFVEKFRDATFHTPFRVYFIRLFFLFARPGHHYRINAGIPFPVPDFDSNERSGIN